MLEGLLAERRAGEVDFARAWRHANARARANGAPRPRDYLCAEDDPGWLPFSVFYREACRREWRGLVRADYLGLRESLVDGGLSAASRSSDRFVPGNGRIAILA